MKPTAERGSAILIAMISSLVVALVISFIMQQNQQTETSTRGPRVKSAMAVVESQLIAAAYDGTLFTDCVAGDPYFSVPGCKKVNPAELPKYQIRLPGAKCSNPSMFCGISIQSENFNPTTQTLTARIVYSGEEISMKAIDVSTQITAEAWASQTSNCPASTPLLVGFDASGGPQCRALPANCPVGQYVSGFDPMSITGPNAVTCAPITGTPSCPAGQFISNFQWQGGSSFQIGCQAVFNPFVPVPAALGDATVYSYEASSLGTQAAWPAPPPSGCSGGETWQPTGFVDNDIGSAGCYIPICSNIIGTTMAWNFTHPVTGNPLPLAWCVNDNSSRPDGCPTNNPSAPYIQGGNARRIQCASAPPPPPPPPACADPINSPVTLVSRQYCSGETNPFTGTNCTPIVPYADGGTYHSANTLNSNQSVTVYFTWNSANYRCEYSAYLSSTSSTGAITGTLIGGTIPGFSCRSVDWFYTSTGWGSAPGGMSGGLNILGPGPGYVTCP